MVSNRGAVASDSGYGNGDSQSSRIDIEPKEQDRKSNLALVRYLDEKDSHQQFLVTGQHDEAQYATEKAEEVIRLVTEWEEASREAAKDATTATR